MCLAPGSAGGKLHLRRVWRRSVCHGAQAPAHRVADAASMGSPPAGKLLGGETRPPLVPYPYYSYTQTLIWFCRGPPKMQPTTQPLALAVWPQSIPRLPAAIVTTIVGTLILTLSAKIQVPFYPVPMT